VQQRSLDSLAFQTHSSAASLSPTSLHELASISPSKYIDHLLAPKISSRVVLRCCSGNFRSCNCCFTLRRRCIAHVKCTANPNSWEKASTKASSPSVPNAFSLSRSRHKPTSVEAKYRKVEKLLRKWINNGPINTGCFPVRLGFSIRWRYVNGVTSNSPRLNVGSTVATQNSSALVQKRTKLLVCCQHYSWFRSSLHISDESCGYILGLAL